MGFDFGPTWVWVLGFICAAVGFLVIVIGLMTLVLYLISHLRLV